MRGALNKTRVGAELVISSYQSLATCNLAVIVNITLASIWEVTVQTRVSRSIRARMDENKRKGMNEMCR